MTAADRIVAIDVGTQSVRALVIGPDGRFVASARIPIEPYVAPQPGWAEQSPAVYWDALVEACRRVLAEPVVAAGRPRRRDPHHAARHHRRDRRSRRAAPAGDRLARRPAHRRARRRSAASGGATALAFRALGLRDTIETFAAAGEANWLRAEEPETWRGSATTSSCRAS